MKLLLCPACWDVFKLAIRTRSCQCGAVSGRYVDNLYAEVNGKGVSLAIGNGSLFNAMRAVEGGAERADVMCWTRPNEGPANPHTRVVKDAA